MLQYRQFLVNILWNLTGLGLPLLAGLYAIPVLVHTLGLEKFGILALSWMFIGYFSLFAFINIARVLLGVITFVGPVLILPFTTKLNDIVTVLLLARVVIWFMHLGYVFYVFPELKKISFQKKLLKPLLRFGGWLTVSNIIGPFMVYFDRFVIGALLSLTAVSYYTTPYEINSKLLLNRSALVGVLFPIFARYHHAYHEDGRRIMVKYYSRGEFLLVLTMFPLILLIVNYADIGLSLWLDEQFAMNSRLVLQLLALGVYFNSTAQISFALLQGVGRADLCAKTHLLEVVIYLPSLFLATTHYGIAGAAFVWMIRAIVDTALLQLLARKLIPEIASDQSKIIFFNIFFSLNVGVLIIWCGWPLSFLSILLAIFTLIIFLYGLVLPKTDKIIVVTYFRQFLPNQKK
jgi:O-antigen/teichoic acid export membrane protein